MKSIGTVLLQALLLVSLGLVVGLSTNALRGRQHIDLHRDYRIHRQAAPTPVGSEPPGRTAAAVPEVATSPGAATQPASGQRTVSFDELAAIINDPNRYGLDAIIDARDDVPYRDGHIPGAVQFWPYAPDYYMAAVDRAMAAERVILYCNGGECADSHMAGELLQQYGILPEQIFIYAGGWEEWEAKNMPIEKNGG